MHALSALNTVLRLRDAKKLFDEKLKERTRKLWLRIKASGVQLLDPPLLFDNADEYLESEEKSNGGVEES